MKTSTHMRNRRRFKSGVDPMQQKSAALTIVGFMMIVLFAMGSSFQSDPTAEKQESLRRQKARFTTSKYQDPGRRDYGNCVIEPAVVPEHRVQSTFTASYPGSGAKMTWKLIEAMTGLVTGKLLPDLCPMWRNRDQFFISIFADLFVFITDTDTFDVFFHSFPNR